MKRRGRHFELKGWKPNPYETRRDRHGRWIRRQPWTIGQGQVTLPDGSKRPYVTHGTGVGSATHWEGGTDFFRVDLRPPSYAAPDDMDYDESVGPIFRRKLHGLDRGVHQRRELFLLSACMTVSDPTLSEISFKQVGATRWESKCMRFGLEQVAAGWILTNHRDEVVRRFTDREDLRAYLQDFLDREDTGQ